MGIRRLGALLFFLAQCSLLLRSAAQSACDCGFVDPEDPHQMVWTDLWNFSFVGMTGQTLDPHIWVLASTYVNATDSQYAGRQYDTSNVVLGDDGLELMITPPQSVDDYVMSAEIISKSADFGFGIYHMDAQLTNVPGTVGAMYTYWNATEEVDVEYVSRSSGHTINFAVKPQIYDPNGQADMATIQYVGLPFDPSQAFHTYSFIWLPEIVTYGIDGQYSTSLTTNVPQVRGAFVLSHWSDGSPFSGGPPTTESMMIVNRVWAYFNSSVTPPLACQQTQTPCTTGGTNVPPGNITLPQTADTGRPTTAPSSTTTGAFSISTVSIFTTVGTAEFPSPTDSSAVRISPHTGVLVAFAVLFAQTF